MAAIERADSSAVGEGVTQTQVLSEDYRRMQQTLHENPNYGVASVQYAPLVADLLRKSGERRILDYGAGKGRLAETLRQIFPDPVDVNPYDPAIPAWSATPSPSRFVTCIDVLEHIEPEFLDNVLDDLRRVTERLGFFTVHTGPAVKVLPDGRNAHLIQQPASWWLPKIMQRFDLLVFNRVAQGFWVLVEPRAH